MRHDYKLEEIKKINFYLRFDPDDSLSKIKINKNKEFLKKYSRIYFSFDDIFYDSIEKFVEYILFESNLVKKDNSFKVNLNDSYVMFNKEKHYYNSIKDKQFDHYLKYSVKSIVKSVSFVISITSNDNSELTINDKSEFNRKNIDKKIITFKAWFAEKGESEIRKMFRRSFFVKKVKYNGDGKNDKINFREIMEYFKKKYDGKYYINENNKQIRWYIYTNLKENLKEEVNNIKTWENMTIKDLNDNEDYGLNKLKNYNTVYLLAKISNKDYIEKMSNEDHKRITLYYVEKFSNLCCNNFEICFSIICVNWTNYDDFINEIKCKLKEKKIHDSFTIVNLDYKEIKDPTKLRNGEHIFIKFGKFINLFGGNINTNYIEPGKGLINLIGDFLNIEYSLLKFVYDDKIINENINKFSCFVSDFSGFVQDNFICLKYQDNEKHGKNYKKIKITSKNFDKYIYDKDGIFGVVGNYKNKLMGNVFASNSNFSMGREFVENFTLNGNPRYGKYLYFKNLIFDGETVEFTKK